MNTDDYIRRLGEDINELKQKVDKIFDAISTKESQKYSPWNNLFSKNWILVLILFILVSDLTYTYREKGVQIPQALLQQLPNLLK